MQRPRSSADSDISRRQFLGRIARFGGSAVLGTLFALDLLADDRRFHLQLQGRAPEGRRRVVILGAGLAGLSAAYELRKIGYECQVLEARARPGGRCWTVRRDTHEVEIGGAAQTCRYADGHYFNPGPMRIPHHHTTTLGYCREFGIPLAVFTNYNEAAYIVRRDHGRMRIREVVADMRGYTSELLSKVTRSDRLDRPLSTEDRERLIEYLRSEGRLDATLSYRRTGDNSDSGSHLDHSRGYTRSPGAVGGVGEPTVPLDLEVLLKAAYARDLGFTKDYNQQPTMLTPMGGMDRIASGFSERLAEIIHYRSVVREIRRDASGGVRIHYQDAASGDQVRTIDADFCIAALPPHLMRQLPNDFSPDVEAALRSCSPGAAGKIGLQFKRRFWEEDDDIYGGCSKTDDAIGQIYYPCDNYGAAGPGVVIGYYHFGGATARLLDGKTPVERERLALEQGARIHDQYPAEFDNSFSVAWSRLRYSEGAWVSWDEEDDFLRAQKVLRTGDGPFQFAGDWASDLIGWQAGAFVSAHRACMHLHERALHT